MQMNIQLPYKMLQAYNTYCRPLCQQMNLPQTAFDILMFLANNPEFNTAKDIVKIRGIKANLVSINVDKLVQEGYIKRTPVLGDRRKTCLTCTDKAKPLIEQGRHLQQTFFHTLFEDIDHESLRIFREVFCSMDKTLDRMLKEKRV